MTPQPPPAASAVSHVPLFVLVSGWPGSGKTTLARGLAAELRLPLLSKDEIKEELCDALGQPGDVAGSQRLGRAAVLTMLAVARACPGGAVLDSTWFGYSVPLLRELPGRVVQVRCVVTRELARSRYRTRTQRHSVHLDAQRSDDELWGTPVPDLGVGPLIDVATHDPVDARQVASQLISRAASVPL